MCNLLAVNPTKDSLATGQQINQAVAISVYLGPDLGSGTVTQYTDNSFMMNGSYNAFDQSGNLSVTVVSAANDLWNVEIEITGSEHDYGREFQATCNQQGNTLVFKSDSSDDTVTVSQDNGSTFTDGKILLNASWVPVTVEIIAS